MSFAWHHSIYMVSDLPAIQISLYLVHIALAFFFMIGRGLPWITVILWFFQVSLRNRNFSITDGGDDIAVILLFISIFLPLKKLPINAEAAKVETRFTKIWNALWSMVFTVQLLSMYFFSALKKTDVSWKSSFTATALSLRLDNIASSFGHALLHFPTLLKASTAIVFNLEFFGPLIFLGCYLLPLSFTPRLKKIICILFMLLHVSILAIFRLWSFPLMCITAWIALYPSSDTEIDTEEKNDEPTPVNLEEIQEESHPFDHLGEKMSYAFLLFPVLILLTILDWNRLEVDSRYAMPEITHFTGQQLSLWQNWGMFAPYPTLNNNHFKFIGTKNDGSEVEVFNESQWLENRHRVKFLLNIATTDNVYVGGLARYYCKKNPALTKLRIDAHNSIINKETLAVKEEDTTIWNQDCTATK